ncbi:MAG: hydrolase 1, exosortase A system-associated [Gammaproteobacteria bacterium]
MNGGGAPIRAVQLEGRGGARLALYYVPVGARHPLGNLLVVPAFAEEMNRCRSMVSMQARAFAQIGIGTLVLDPFGTGDSAGEFAEATWAQWREDLRAGIDWLRKYCGGCRGLWGVRLGAIMAAELAASDADIRQLLFWQPVVDGKQFCTQFLRIRIAAEMEQSGGIKSTDQLRKMAADGEVIEVSGYHVNGELVSALDAARMPDAAALSDKRVAWFEVLPAADSNVPRPNLKVIETWQAAGTEVRIERVVGPSFWQVHEREVAPDLIQAGTRLFSERAASATAPAASGTNSEFASPQSSEYPVMFPCGQDQLAGIIHRGKAGTKRGVVIVVAGGPQYRAGAHRQFVSLARRLAAQGNPVLRFDLRGMGDSSGEYRGFQHSEVDIRAAIDALLAQEPALDSVVLLGECESASGILFYAYRDPRAQGLVLVNPWVRTDGGRAEVIMKHYYLSRVMSREFWRKVIGGKFNPVESLTSFAATGRAYLSGRKLRRVKAADDEDISNLPLPVKTATALRRYRGQVLILMSGNDYIAREFDEVVRSSQAWVGLLEDARVRRRDLEGADHTFSRASWKRQAQDWVCEWVASW